MPLMWRSGISFQRIRPSLLLIFGLRPTATVRSSPRLWLPRFMAAAKSPLDLFSTTGTPWAGSSRNVPSPPAKASKRSMSPGVQRRSGSASRTSHVSSNALRSVSKSARPPTPGVNSRRKSDSTLLPVRARFGFANGMARCAFSLLLNRSRSPDPHWSRHSQDELPEFAREPLHPPR